MIEPDLKTTLREFQEYVDLSYESPREFAVQIGVAKPTIWYWLSGKRQPKAKSLAKLRRFLDNEAKRPGSGRRDQVDRARTIQNHQAPSASPVYARLCPFCRKARGKIRKLGAASFQGTCPKCGATGPKRESHQEALRRGMGGSDVGRRFLYAQYGTYSANLRDRFSASAGFMRR